MNLKQLSDGTGIEYQYLTKLMRGDLTMQLHHLGAIETTLPGAVFGHLPFTQSGLEPRSEEQE